MTDIQIHNYDTPNQPQDDTEVWNTAAMQAAFEVLGFSAPFVAVRRRSDGVKGTLEFKHQPRVYFDFKPDA